MAMVHGGGLRARKTVVLATLFGVGLVACGDGGPDGYLIDVGKARDGGGAGSDGDVEGSPSVPPIWVREDCGAVGDGETDDTEAIRACLREGVLPFGSGVVVRFSKGTYLITSPISVPIGQGKSLTVEGTDGPVLVSQVEEPPEEPATNETGILEFVGEAGAKVSLKGIALEHEPSPDHGNLDGLWIRGPFDEVDLDRVTVRGATIWGIKLDGVRGGTVTDSTAERNHHGGLAVHDSSNLVVTGGSYSENGTKGVLGWGYGMAVHSSATAGPSKDITVRNVVANGNLRKGLDVHHGHSILFEKNTVVGFGSAGIYATNEGTGKDVRDIVIRDNLIDGMNGTGPPPAVVIAGVDVGASGGNATESGRFVITGNKIVNLNMRASVTQANAVFVRNPKGGFGTDYVEITDNEITDGTNGSSAVSAIVFTNNNAVPIGHLHIADNTMHASKAAVGIDARLATHLTVSNNSIVVDGGSVATGISVGGSPNTAYVVGNALGGGASFVTPITSLGNGHSRRRNTSLGSALPDQGCEPRVVSWEGDFDGDGKLDLLGLLPNGALRLYPGLGAGLVGTSRMVGSGWNAFDRVLGTPDLGGDGTPDLLAMLPNGDLFAYSTDGAGGWRPKEKVGTSWQTFDRMIAPGDLSGDGKADVVGMYPNPGDMYLYPGDGSNGWKARELVGTSWHSFGEVLAPGDFDGDGQADVIGMYPDGELWLYPGNGASGWLARVKIGTGWQVFDTIAGVGEFSNGSGVDLVTQQGCHGTSIYPGTGAGGFQSSRALDLDR
ncbi:MAG: VCBS repeat-containing protein [Myxococcales bacterium]|nr:VCBS repeat-containing protein [Myxococcales bacterium]